MEKTFPNDVMTRTELAPEGIVTENDSPTSTALFDPMSVEVDALRVNTWETTTEACPSLVIVNEPVLTLRERCSRCFESSTCRARSIAICTCISEFDTELSASIEAIVSR